MAQDRPAAAELLSAIADFLREETTPVLDRAEPRLGFQMRVAANSLAILEREARLGPAADAREHQRLVALLGRDGTLEELNRALAQQLRTGQRDERDPALMAHLEATIATRLPSPIPSGGDDDRDAVCRSQPGRAPVGGRTRPLRRPPAGRVRPAALRRAGRLRNRPAARRAARRRSVRTVRTPDDHDQGGRLLATILEGDPPEVRIEPDWDRSPTVSRAWFDQQVSEALAEVDRRRRRYRDGSRPVSPTGRVAIVVDQAIGPGHAMAGALRLIRGRGRR